MDLSKTGVLCYATQLGWRGDPLSLSDDMSSFLSQPGGNTWFLAVDLGAFVRGCKENRSRAS